MDDIFTNKKILVTGGTGFIGSEVVRQLLNHNPGVVRIYSRDEHKQFIMQNELSEYANLRFLLGDVRDKNRLKRAMEDIDIVFHCSAYKHVPACEYNPFEAVKTNVLGTQNVVECALDNNVEKVVLISTDKATSPLNVMGATKLLAERLMSSAMYARGSHKTSFSSVRFGNVIGSRGSVIPLFFSQIMKGGPVTVTNPDMTRFFMSISQCVNLVFTAAKIMHGGEVFILKMPVVRLGDLVEVMVKELSNEYNIKDVEIKIVGSRPGEKMYELLMTEEESLYSQETDEMFILLPQIEIPHRKMEHYTYPNAYNIRVKTYDSRNIKCISHNEIKQMLIEAKIL